MNSARDDPTVLDVGAGIGTFTLPIVSRVRGVLPRASFYAMDLTPTMLRILSGRTGEVRSFIGLAENIPGSIRHAQRHLGIPDAFDAVLSALTLHHCPHVQLVLASFKQVLDPGGRAVVVDLCEHSFKEFREEMGDYHLGFNLHELQEVALRYFDQVKVQTFPGISCSCSGRSADVFTSTMTVRNRP
ncbi:MAG: methyltransferase domain-containing protein [Candidatus Bathyarchaeia archaeon]